MNILMKAHKNRHLDMYKQIHFTYEYTCYLQIHMLSTNPSYDTEISNMSCKIVFIFIQEECIFKLSE